MNTVLASGFGPFPPHDDNPSWDALVNAAPRLPNGWRLDRVCLDVAWDRAAQSLLDRLTEDVRLVVAFGQADDPAVRIERFAVNASNRALLDIDGATFGRDSIVETGPSAYETRLPRQALLARLAAHDFNAVESHFAGGYLCNYTFYRLLHALADRPAVAAGFVHVPPSWRLAIPRTRAAMETIIECALESIVGD